VNKITKHGTLCYIKKENQILLQKKSKELFGGDKYNAPGGKIKENETPELAVIREVEEETGLQVSNLKKHGVLTFYDGDEELPAWIVHVFSTADFQGELKTEVREGVHGWVDNDKIPFDKMWEDDKYWIPLVFEDKNFTAKFWFEKNFGPIWKKEINEH